MPKSLIGVVLKVACPVLAIGVTSFAAVMVNTNSGVALQDQPQQDSGVEQVALWLSDLRVALNERGDVDGVTIRDRNNEPVPGLTVTFHVADGAVSSVTDRLGQFEILQIDPGNYDVDVTGPGVAMSYVVSVLPHSEAGVVPIAFDPDSPPIPLVLYLVIPQEDPATSDDDDDPLPPLGTDGGFVTGAPPVTGGGPPPLTPLEVAIGGGIIYGIIEITQSDSKASPANP